MRLEQEINHLLQRHDCVIVPGFGGFLGRRSGAFLQPSTHYIVPPGKRISFNGMLQDNDGLLATHLVLHAGLSHAEALKTIQGEVARWKDQLAQGRRIQIDGVGRLFSSVEGKVQFAPTYQDPFAAQSFGFQIIRLEPLQEEAAAPSAKPAAEAIVRTLPLPTGASARWKAAAILVPLIGWVSWNVYQGPVSDALPQYAGMQPVPYVQTLEEAPVPAAKPKKESPVVEATKPTPSVKAKSAQGSYHIVVGAFGERGNALAYLATLQGKGVNAYIVQSPGKLTRVAVGPYTSNAQAQADLTRVKGEVSAGAWVYRK